MNIVQFDLAGAPRIDLEEARKSFDRAENVVFVDVRSQVDYDKAHIHGAIAIPLRELPRRLSEFSPDAEIITY